MARDGYTKSMRKINKGKHHDGAWAIEDYQKGY